MIRILIVLLLLWLPGCATTSSQEWARFSDGSLNEWMDQEAIPGLTKTLSAHPRFKAETIRIAALDGQQVAGRSNGLTTAVRDALHSAFLQEPGLSVVRVEGPESCTAAPVNGYYVAVETSPSGSRGANVQLRIFDIVERQWVSGFSHQWRGDLSSAQREALRRPVIAESARGLRVSPFTADQSDLLAERLASDLACQLKRHGDDELVVQPARDRSAALIAGNLAGNHRIPVATDGQLELETRVHKVDDDLYQIWAILTPKNASDEISAVTTSAYATRPLLKAASKRPATAASAATGLIPAVIERSPEIELLSRLRVVGTGCTGDFWRKRNNDLGDRPVIAPDACFGLAFERHPGAHVYLISHDVDADLKRLSPSRCVRAVSDLRAGAVRFPVNGSPLAWDARSGTETFYVIAARGQRATTRLDRLIARLPDACGSGDDKAAAERWLSDIDSAVRSLGNDVAWQAVRVYHQPRDGAQRLGSIGGAKR